MAIPSLSVFLPMALMLSGLSAAAATTSFPATAEVDLVLPLNTTYAPTALFPIVFAFQNSELFPTLDPSIDLALWDANNMSSSPSEPLLSLQNFNFSSGEPTHAYRVLNITEGEYLLTWWFTVNNCSKSNYSAFLEFSGGSANKTGSGVHFTVASGGQQPLSNESATTSASLCGNASYQAFNLTGTLPVFNPGNYDRRNTCAVLSETQPLVKGNPCAATMNEAAQSSLAAAITSSACLADHPVVSCPASSSANVGAMRWSLGLAGGLAFAVFGVTQW